MFGKRKTTTRQEATSPELEALKKDVARLTEQLQGAVDMARSLVAQMANYQQMLKLQYQMNRLAVFLRENYAEEIASGKHAGMDSAIDAAIYYMSRERELSGHTKGGPDGN